MASRLAIALMVAQAALFATETAIIHHIGLRVSVMQLALFRGCAGLLLVAILARNIGWPIIKTNGLRIQLLRGFVTVAYAWVMLYSFARLPFADATAISYSQAVYIAVFSSLILRERIAMPRWTAAITGIVGAILIVKPTFSHWNSVYLVALIGTSFNGLAFVLNKYLQTHQSDSEVTTLFCVNALLVLFNIPGLTITNLPDLEIWPWVTGVLLLGPLGMYLGIVAVRDANASVLGPYTLLRLVIAVIGGVVVFREMPDVFGMIGSGLIFAGCVLAVVPEPPRMRHQVAVCRG